MEPQGWGSYERAVKKNKSLSRNLGNLEIRPEYFKSILQEIGFSCLHEVKDQGLQRGISIYQKN